MATDLIEGRFLRRRNRFAADVEVDGAAVVAHVPNSGRMRELLVEGACVLLAAMQPGGGRFTLFDLVRVWYVGRWVGVDARVPPRVVEEAWRRGLLDLFPIAPAPYAERGLEVSLRREVRFGESRLDLLFEGPSGRCYVEAKSVNLVEDGVALFPDAPTTRGARHVRALVHAVRNGHGAAAVFVIQRDDAFALMPHVVADPDFARALCEARDAGVRLYALTCCVTPEELVPIGLVPVCLPDLQLATQSLAAHLEPVEGRGGACASTSSA